MLKNIAILGAVIIALTAGVATAPERACASGNCAGYCSEEQLVCPAGCACNFVTNNCF
jgi:hypothetical protein